MELLLGLGLLPASVLEVPKTETEISQSKPGNRILFFEGFGLQITLTEEIGTTEYDDPIVFLKINSLFFTFGF